MDTALLIARLLLALVFAVAGLAKLADREGSRRAVIDFGLPAALATPLGILLPLAEIAVAAALIPTASAWWGALGALTLLLLFVVGIGFNLARGKRPDCHCFGQLHSAPAGWSTLIRNGFLATVAGFVLWGGWESPGTSVMSVGSWLEVLPITQLVVLIGGLILLGLIAGQWWSLLHLLRQNGRLLVRLEALESKLAGGDAPSLNGIVAQTEGLPVGEHAPAFTLEGLYGETLTLDSLRASGKPVMLFFTDPDCGPCTALLPEIGRWQEEHSDKLSIALISRGTPEENRAKSSEHGLTQVLLQNDWEVSEAYKVRGTPSAVVVRPDGSIGSPVVIGSEAIRDLVKRAVEAPTPNAPLLPEAPAPAAQGEPCPNCGKRHPAEGAPAIPETLKIGEPAPDIELKDLAGKDMNLKDLEGQETLVLFWNPGCGFCQQMLDDLKEWEENTPEGAPKLLVVSTGPVEANEAMGLSSPVVLDQNFSVGRSFGAAGTPSAVLVDKEGKIASEVAVGAPAVLDLAGAKNS